MTLQDLITELEAATVPSFVLDAKIQSVLMPETVGLHPPQYSYSIDNAVRLVKNVLPGWGWRVATCHVSDDAWVFPDFNCPKHGERLKRECRWDIDWADLTDVDLRPAGRPAIALVIAICRAKLAQEEHP